MNLKMANKLLIGSHVSMNKPEYFLGSVKEALSYGSTSFMFYTGAPQNSFRVPLEMLRIDEGKKLMSSSGIEEKDIVVHAPYIINLASPKEETFNMSVDVLMKELKRTHAFGAKTLVLHPGSHVGGGLEFGINQIAKGLDIALDQANNDVTIALETMAGKGSEVGSKFEELAEIISLCRNKDKLGICLDTCHMSDSGYDISQIDVLIEKMNETFGSNRVKCIHINDSKNPRGSHKDRHANIGYGEIGYDIIYRFVFHPLFENVPKILETPYIEEKPPYKEEISMLKNSYIDGWMEKFIK